MGMSSSSPHPSSALPPGGPQAPCAWVQARVDAFVRWELSEDEFARVEEHLGTCLACAAAVRDREAAAGLPEQLVAAGLSAEGFTAGVMGRVRAWEAEQTWRRRRRILVRIAACLAALLTGWLACHFALRPEPQPVLAQSPAPHPDVPTTQSTATTAAAQAPAAGLDRIRDEIVAEATQSSLLAEIGLDLPRTETAYETWARSAFPDVFWAREAIAAGTGRQPSWREFLIGSGELFHLDWPRTPAAPVRSPSLAAAESAAAQAGFSLSVDSVGDAETPSRPWQDTATPTSPCATVAPFGPGSHRPAPRHPAPVPQGYANLLARQPEIADRILCHLLVAIRLADQPGSAPTAARCTDLLLRLRSITRLPSRNVPGCASCSPQDGAAGLSEIAGQTIRLAQSLAGNPIAAEPDGPPPRR